MFPDGYAANLKRGASLDKLKIFGLKSHAWHIWIERVMPVESCMAIYLGMAMEMP